MCSLVALVELVALVALGALVADEHDAKPAARSNRSGTTKAFVRMILPARHTRLRARVFMIDPLVIFAGASTPTDRVGGVTVTPGLPALASSGGVRAARSKTPRLRVLHVVDGLRHNSTPRP